MDAPALLSGSRPWFAAAAALCVVGLVAFGGTARAVLESVAGIVFLLACTRYIGLAVRDDPVRSRMVRRGLVGLAAQESGIAQRRRAATRAGRR
jgi:hypothetical protein